MPTAIDGKKICARCRIEKPATIEYFQRASTRPDGLKPYCKECLRIPDQERHKGRSAHKHIGGIEYKSCTICGEWKIASTEYFFSQHGRLKGHCKECLRAKRGTKTRASRNDAKIIEGILSKPCTKCEQWKPADTTHFPPFKEGKGGLHPWCRDCIRTNAYHHSLRSGKVKSHQDQPIEVNANAGLVSNGYRRPPRTFNRRLGASWACGRRVAPVCAPEVLRMRKQTKKK